MKVVIQRVSHASVTVDGNVVGKIDKGFLLLVGFTQSDTEAEIKKVADKLSGLRIFEDEQEGGREGQVRIRRFDSHPRAEKGRCGNSSRIPESLGRGNRA